METDIAFVYPGGIRANLDKGDITWGEVYTVFPLDYSLVKMNMTGEQMKAVLEQQWMGSEPLFYEFPVCTIHGKSKRQLERIIELMNENGTPIDDSQIYTVTMNEFLAEGGDGFSVFQEGTMIQARDLSELDALTQYIQGL